MHRYTASLAALNAYVRRMVAEARAVPEAELAARGDLLAVRFRGGLFCVMICCDLWCGVVIVGVVSLLGCRKKCGGCWVCAHDRMLVRIYTVLTNPSTPPIYPPPHSCF